MRTTDASERPLWIWTFGGLAALILVHLLEPDFPLAWSYAGLRVRWGTVAPAVLAVLAIPPLVALAWRSAWAQRPMPRIPPGAIVGGTLALWLALSILGLAWPVVPVCADPLFLIHELRTGGRGTPRWLLTVPLFQLLYAPVRDAVSPPTALRVVNALFSTLSFVVTFAIAARIGRSWREVLAIVLLVWTAFGSVQLAVGYVDVYPLVQLLFALYLWTALRFLDGGGSVAWPVVVGILGPLFYVGLILLGPSVAVLAWVAYRRCATRTLVVSGVAAIVVASLATIPAYGAPFGLVTWLSRLATASVHGMNPDGQVLPLAHMLSVGHAGEVLSTFVLLDGTALVLLPALALRSERGAFLWSILVAGLAFVVAMDPLWGPYADWDLFSYLTLPIGIAGAVAFLALSRARPSAAGLLLGLALAASTVHLLARLNAMDLDFDEHIAASPYHIPGLPDGIIRPRSR